MSTPSLPRLSAADSSPWSWQRHSYLRWGLALAGGIVWARLPFPFPLQAACYAWPLLLGLLLLCHWRSCSRLFGVVALASVAGAGLWLSRIDAAPESYAWPEGEADYRVLLTETPRLRGRHLRCEARLQMVVQGEGTVPAKGHPACRLYLPADSLAAALRSGDCLWVRTTLKQRWGMGWGFVAAGRWLSVGQEHQLSWPLRLALWRERLVAVYGRWGLSDQVQAVLSALTLGDKSGIDADLRSYYQQAGAAHVLALSGLHVGMLALLVVGLLRSLVRLSGWFHYPALCLAVVVLWLYAGLTGSPPSALRATLLFTLLLWAGFPLRQRLGLEVLLATAFWMLVFRPGWLFDIGFQLSFAAVASLLLWQPLLASLWQPQSPFLRAVWQLATAAVAAQAGTAPLVAYYFGSLPVHFLFTSLWVVPWTSLLLVATGVLWLLTPWPEVAQGWASVVQQLVEMQHTVLSQVSHWPFSTLGPLHVDGLCVLLAYGELAAVGWLLHRRSGRALLPVVGFALLLMLYSAW